MERIKNNLVTILIIAVAAVAAFSIYLFVDKFGLGYWGTVERWGATGDFFGGILNPIIAFTTLILLVYTLRQNNTALEQNKEALENSRQELELTRGELEKSAEALREQVSVSKQQRFEHTFFSLLDEVNQLKASSKNDTENAFKSLSGLIKKLNDEQSDLQLFSFTYYGKKQSSRSLAIAAAFELKKRYELFLEAHSAYFRTLYQLLKFIRERAETKDRKYYSNIVRSTLSNELLSILVINCFYQDEEDQYFKFHKLLTEMEFLEHLTENLFSGTAKNNLIFVLASVIYDRNAFGKNPYIDQERDSTVDIA